MRRTALTGAAVTAAVVGVLGAAGAAGEASPPSFIRADDCVEHQAFLAGDPAAVARRLPTGYTAVVDPASGRPLLFARAERCQVSVAGRTAPATMASFGIVISSPDGRGCSSGAPGAGQADGQLPPVCNWYPLVWLASDSRVSGWLRAGAPAFPAVEVAGLAFHQGAPDATGGAPFHFGTSSPGQWAFAMDDVGHAQPGTIDVRGGYWAGTGDDAVKLAFSTDDITPGHASGSVTTPAGTEVARLLGARQAAYLPAYSAVGAEQWGHGSYRKQLLGPAPGASRFAGSCSIQGTDAFTPPASNTPRDLHVTYDATGTCSGTLDGREVSGVGVRWHSGAHSYGSCSQANTVEPGEATMTFPGGTTIGTTFDFTSSGTQIAMSFYGERSGFAQGDATFATQRTTPGVVTACAGTGTAQAPMDLELTTQSPLVSGGASSSPSPAGRPSPRPELRLSVHPAVARDGRATTFAFRVHTAAGRPVAGAGIRFGGQLARTGPGGLATIRRRPAGHGLRTVIATKHGFRPATVVIRVRRAEEEGP